MPAAEMQFRNHIEASISYWRYINRRKQMASLFACIIVNRY